MPNDTPSDTTEWGGKDAARGRQAVARPSAIVVGSGFGGAVAACRLAQAGFDIVILERGRRYASSDFPAAPIDSALLPEFRRWSWQHNQGLWDVVDLEEVVSVQAAGYGGGSLVYANVHLRPPDAIFDAQWPAVYRDPASLRPYYELAAYMLDVAPADSRAGFRQGIIKADQLRRAAHRLNRDEGFFHPPLAIRYTSGTNRQGVEQQACTSCGRCVTGCPEGAKNTLDHNYLALAERHGARVVSQCEVLDIEQRGGRWVAKCFDHITARATRHEADALFLCAGSVHSTRLLARARLDPASRRAQSNAGVGYFPGGDAIGTVFDTDEPQQPSTGPTISTTLVHFDRDDPASFFMIQDGGYGPELERLVGVSRAPLWLGRNRLTQVEPGRRAREPHGSRAVEPEAPADEFILSSMFDELLEAWSTGAFSGVVSAEVRQAFSRWLDEFERPLLLSAVVDATIQRSALAALERRWPTRLFPAKLRRALAALQSWGAHLLFGSGEQIAAQALRAVVGQAGLSRREIARRVLGFDGARASHRAVLLGMGRDAAPGHLHYDRRSNKLWADLDLYYLAPGYTREERLMTDIAGELGGELRTNPAWAFVGKPVTVHSQGGCRMSDTPDTGVTDPDGRVHGCEGLYILDGSVLPAPVGVNPSATILAIAERNIERFLRRHPGSAWSDPASEASRAYAELRQAASSWVASNAGWHFTPPRPSRAAPDFSAQPLGLRFSEWMQGYYCPTAEGGAAPRDDADYRAAEARGRPGAGGSHDAIGFPIEFALQNSVADLNVYYEDMNHAIRVCGTVDIRLPGRPAASPLQVSGELCLFVPRRKPYAIDRTTQRGRLRAQEAATGRPYRTLPDRYPARRQRQRFLRYELILEGDAQSFWLLRGKKRVRDDAGFDAWRDTSTLFVRLFGPFPERPDLSQFGWQQRYCRPQQLAGAGAVHVDITRFLHQQLPSFQVFPTDDPARISWAITKFATFFYGELQRIYMPELFTALDTFFRLRPSNIRTGNAR